MPRNGIYLHDGSFMKFAESSKSISAEIATRSRSLDAYAIGNLYLPNPDPVLKKQGKDIQVYTDLMTDDRVGGSMINRINATLALDWEIDHGKSSKSRKARFIKEVFAALPLTTIIEQTIRGARAFGYNPTETVWTKRGDGLNAPVNVIAKPQHWFVFGQDNDLRFLSRERMMEGEELPPRRFLCPTNEATYANPYGLGLNSRCFWPVVFKRGGWRFRIKFAEKYGAVWPVGKLPRSAGQDQIDDMLEILEEMINDGVAVIPDDGSVDFLESGSKGSTSDMFHAIIADANSAISTIWLGHAGAGEAQSGDKLSKDSTAESVRRDLRDADKTLVEQTMNQLIDWICEENWGTSADAPRFSLWEEEDVDKDQAERDINLTAALEKSGLKLSRAYYLRTYNLEEGDIEEKEASQDQVKEGAAPPFDKGGAGGEQFAEPAPDSPDNADILAGRLGEEAGPIMEKWLSLLREEVDRAGNLVDLRRDILDAPVDIAPVAEIIRDGLLLGHLLGRAEVLEEIAGEAASFAEPATIADALRLPFAEAIAFFRDKVSIPSEKWNDLFLDAHSRGFMIAGAMKGDLLSDLRQAIDEVISQGLTLREFRQQWDTIVERHGWSYVGGRNWRTRVVYETNTRQAYNAGRWQQITDPDVLRTRPYLLYKHGDSVHPRVLHLSWDGTVLPADDPWWSTHYPQNGWGCKCKVFSAGERDITRLGDKARRTAPDDGAYQWTDTQGRSFDIPNGIDPGFQYNPGTAAQRNYQILDDRIKQLPTDIAQRIRTEIKEKQPSP